MRNRLLGSASLAPWLEEQAAKLLELVRYRLRGEPSAFADYQRLEADKGIYDRIRLRIRILHSLLTEEEL